MKTTQADRIPGNSGISHTDVAAGNGLLSCQRLVEPTEILPPDISSQDTVSRISQGTDNVSKAELLAKIMKEPEIYEMGVEIKLFVRLLIAENGLMSGNYQQLAKMMATDPRNLKRWIKILEQNGRISVEAKRQGQLTVSLCEPLLSVATAPDQPRTQVQPVTPLEADLVDLLNIYRTAKTTGATIRINLEKTINGKAA